MNQSLLGEKGMENPCKREGTAVDGRQTNGENMTRMDHRRCHVAPHTPWMKGWTKERDRHGRKGAPHVQTMA
jgi:hypothetical protein